jgi:hypothetical protein
VRPSRYGHQGGSHKIVLAGVIAASQVSALCSPPIPPLFTSTFETNDLSEWEYAAAQLDGSYTIPASEAVLGTSTEHVHSGTYAVKTAIRAEAGIVNPKCNMYLNSIPSQTESKTNGLHYSYWFFIPALVTMGSGWWMATEWQHQGVGLGWNAIYINNRAGSGNMYPTFARSAYWGSGTWSATSGIDISAGTWHRFQHFYKPGNASDGAIRSLLDGVEWLNLTDITLNGDFAEECHWGLMNYGENHSSSSPTIVYYDDIVVSRVSIP